MHACVNLLIHSSTKYSVCVVLTSYYYSLTRPIARRRVLKSVPLVR